jgi:uncharacterized protein YndB with AHSA1/START domain
MVASKKPRKKSVERKFSITRILAAPRALVFAAWTQPEHLKQWSAPHGFTIPVSEGELKAGGKWRACMVSPKGEKLWLGGVYRKIVPNRLLVFTHAWLDEEGAPETLITVRFADHPRGTKLTLEQTGFDSAESRDGHKGGWLECLERLVDLLGTLQGGPAKHVRRKNSPSAAAGEIATQRILAAPREKVFGAFSDPQVLAGWWGPQGFTNTFHAFDFRPGGIWRFTMHGPDGAAYAMDHRFPEIVLPERIVMRHLQPGHDFTLIVTLADRGGDTEINWRMLFDDPAEAERVRPYVVPANEQNLDRLAGFLAGPASRPNRVVR